MEDSHPHRRQVLHGEHSGNTAAGAAEPLATPFRFITIFTRKEVKREKKRRGWASRFSVTLFALGLFNQV
jgi:hypothetical protein